MGCRLTVGRLTLDQVVGVRIPAAQPSNTAGYPPAVFSFSACTTTRPYGVRSRPIRGTWLSPPAPRQRDRRTGRSALGCPARAHPGLSIAHHSGAAFSCSMTSHRGLDESGRRSSCGPGYRLSALAVPRRAASDFACRPDHDGTDGQRTDVTPEPLRAMVPSTTETAGLPGRRRGLGNSTTGQTTPCACLHPWR